MLHFAHQLLSTSGVALGLAMLLFFVPAMIFINAVVEPEFLDKLRVRRLSAPHHPSFEMCYRSTDTRAGRGC